MRRGKIIQGKWNIKGQREALLHRNEWARSSGIWKVKAITPVV